METLGLGLKDVGVPILGGHLRDLVLTCLDRSFQEEWECAEEGRVIFGGLLAGSSGADCGVYRNWSAVVELGKLMRS